MLCVSLFFNLFLFISAELDRGYGYQTGHISMNDSEITILINSTFEIIEDFDNETDISISQTTTEPSATTLSTAQSETISTTLPSVNATKGSKKQTIRMKKLRPSTNVQCQKYTEAEKYKILEDAGGRNQLFMADTVEEASRNFAGLYPPNPMGIPLDDDVIVAPDAQQAPCGSTCQMIKTALNTEIIRRSSSNATNPSVGVFGRYRAAVFSDAPPTVTSCHLGNFIPVGTCTELGESVDGGTHEALCSECRGVYMLSNNCFPKIFNAVQCNSQEMGCIFDTITDKAHGQCAIDTLAFKVLRNRGDDNCEDWISEQILLPVACKCQLSKSSFLRAKPSREL